MATFTGPRFGPHAARNGQACTQEPCDCQTCKDMGPWLSEPFVVVTWEDGASAGHIPASHIAA